MGIVHLRQRPGSGDCGYFAGFMVGLKNRHGAALDSQSVSVNDVYRARNTYMSRVGGSGRGIAFGMKPSNKDAGLNGSEAMLDYLKGGLKVTGYTGHRVGQAYVQGLDRTLALLRKHAPPWKSKSALLLTINGLSHWVAVLGWRYAPGTQDYGKIKQRPYLRRGSRATVVMLLQAALNYSAKTTKTSKTRYPKLDVDGVFGQKTHRRVREFQDVQRIKVDGVVYTKTWKELEPYIEKLERPRQIKYFDSGHSGRNLAWLDETLGAKAIGSDGIFVRVSRSA